MVKKGCVFYLGEWVIGYIDLGVVFSVLLFEELVKVIN